MSDFTQPMLNAMSQKINVIYQQIQYAEAQGEVLYDKEIHDKYGIKKYRLDSSVLEPQGAEIWIYPKTNKTGDAVVRARFLYCDHIERKALALLAAYRSLIPSYIQQQYSYFINTQLKNEIYRFINTLRSGTDNAADEQQQSRKFLDSFIAGMFQMYKKSMNRDGTAKEFGQQLMHALEMLNLSDMYRDIITIDLHHNNVSYLQQIAPKNFQQIDSDELIHPQAFNPTIITWRGHISQKKNRRGANRYSLEFDGVSSQIPEDKSDEFINKESNREQRQHGRVLQLAKNIEDRQKHFEIDVSIHAGVIDSTISMSMNKVSALKDKEENSADRVIPIALYSQQFDSVGYFRKKTLKAQQYADQVLLFDCLAQTAFEVDDGAEDKEAVIYSLSCHNLVLNNKKPRWRFLPWYHNNSQKGENARTVHAFNKNFATYSKSKFKILATDMGFEIQPFPFNSDARFFLKETDRLKPISERTEAENIVHSVFTSVYTVWDKWDKDESEFKAMLSRQKFYRKYIAAESELADAVKKFRQLLTQYQQFNDVEQFDQNQKSRLLDKILAQEQKIKKIKKHMYRSIKKIEKARAKWIKSSDSYQDFVLEYGMLTAVIFQNKEKLDGLLESNELSGTPYKKALQDMLNLTALWGYYRDFSTLYYARKWYGDYSYQTQARFDAMIGLLGNWSQLRTAATDSKAAMEKITLSALENVRREKLYPAAINCREHNRQLQQQCRLEYVGGVQQKQWAIQNYGHVFSWLGNRVMNLSGTMVQILLPLAPWRKRDISLNLEKFGDSVPGENDCLRLYSDYSKLYKAPLVSDEALDNELLSADSDQEYAAADSMIPQFPHPVDKRDINSETSGKGKEKQFAETSDLESEERKDTVDNLIKLRGAQSQQRNSISITDDILPNPLSNDSNAQEIKRKSVG